MKLLLFPSEVFWKLTSKLQNRKQTKLQISAEKNSTHAELFPQRNVYSTATNDSRPIFPKQGKLM